MAVKHIFTLICDDIRIETSHKLVIIGLYNYSINFSRPMSPPSAPPSDAELKFAMPALCILTRWRVDTPGNITVKTELIDPMGKPVQVVEMDLTAVSTTEYTQQIIKMQGIILALGIYKVRTTYSGGEHTEDFEVKAG